MAGSKEWTEQEKNVLKAMYEQGDQIDIMQALPRGHGAVLFYSNKHGIEEARAKAGGDRRSHDHYR